LSFGQEAEERSPLDELLGIVVVAEKKETTSFLADCKAALEEAWLQVWSETATVEPPSVMSEELLNAIREAVNSDTKTYRYVLPTQLVAKLANPLLDCRSVQAGADSEGAFDARSVASKVISPFDLSHERVLGGSTDPYVSNPLRVTAVDPSQRDAQKDKVGWDRLCLVLQAVETNSNPEFTASVFRQVLREIKARLELVHVTYPFPHRVSLDDTLRITREFLKEKSSGDRFECLLAALFSQLGSSFGLYSEVLRTKSNSADASTGMVADIECRDSKGALVAAVEAKDRNITVTQLQEKIPLWREAGLTEAFLIATKDVKTADAQKIAEAQRVEFSSGHNIYCLPWDAFASSIFALIGETGRSEYLKKVAAELDKYSAVQHRRTWADLLKTA
jgi:hypothetical protein